ISECVCLSFFISHPTSCLLIVFPLVPSQNFYLGQLMHLVYHKKSSTNYITFHRLKNNGNLESAHRHHNIFVYLHTMSYMELVMSILCVKEGRRYNTQFYSYHSMS